MTIHPCCWGAGARSRRSRSAWAVKTRGGSGATPSCARLTWSA